MDLTSNEPIGVRLNREVLEPMKRDFVGKEEIIDLMGVALLGGENLFILGPPGTAKSALVQSLGQRLHGPIFSYLLTRFTEPNELFGPFDIRRLREGELTTNTEGMLSEASFVFLDELLNANSAILNSLLAALNERTIHRGRERLRVQALMFIGASNRLPEDEALNALFDRFLLRVHSGPAAPEQLGQVLDAGWRLESAGAPGGGLSLQEVRVAQEQIRQVSLGAVRAEYVALIHRIRHAGIKLSDRRAVKLQRVMAASALLCGRLEARISDLWVLRYIWDSEEQQEVLRALVQETVERDESDARHPLAAGTATVDAEALARDLEWLAGQAAGTPTAGERSYLRDRLGILDGRVQWVPPGQARERLLQQVAELWGAMK